MCREWLYLKLKGHGTDVPDTFKTCHIFDLNLYFLNPLCTFSNNAWFYVSKWRKKEWTRKGVFVCFFNLPWWVRLARVPEWASVSRPGHFIDRSWDLASALLCQGDFKSQSPEPWESRERSWAVCSACGVENKPLAGKHRQTHSQPHPQLCRAAVSSD